MTVTVICSRCVGSGRVLLEFGKLCVYIESISHRGLSNQWLVPLCRSVKCHVIMSLNVTDCHCEVSCLELKADGCQAHANHAKLAMQCKAGKQVTSIRQRHSAGHAETNYQTCQPHVVVRGRGL